MPIAAVITSQFSLSFNWGLYNSANLFSLCFASRNRASLASLMLRLFTPIWSVPVNIPPIISVTTEGEGTEVSVDAVKVGVDEVDGVSDAVGATGLLGCSKVEKPPKNSLFLEISAFLTFKSLIPSVLAVLFNISTGFSPTPSTSFFLYSLKSADNFSMV